mmetsp:Transcript_12425/g.57526  ORF Transcript_12425/g.57526 Transcript_12425/m.57526 type:complete len:250 (+) Transcript_12425:510-1259(+)
MPPPSVGVGTKSVADRPTRVDGNASRPSASNALIAVPAMASAAPSSAAWTAAWSSSVSSCAIHAAAPAARWLDAVGGKPRDLDLTSVGSPFRPALGIPARYSRRRCRGCLRSITLSSTNRSANSPANTRSHRCTPLEVSTAWNDLNALTDLTPSRTFAHTASMSSPRATRRSHAALLGSNAALNSSGSSRDNADAGKPPSYELPLPLPPTPDPSPHTRRNIISTFSPNLPPRPLMERIGSDSIISVTAR